MAAGPPELVQYGNGRLPPAVLVSIGGGHRLASAAAAAFLAMKAAASAAGVAIGITDSYRSYDQQVALAAAKGLYSQGGLAATPGTSEHGWGQAVDVSVTASGEAWLRSNAGAFGFVEDTPREPWHWGYHGPGSGKGTGTVAYPNPVLTPAQVAHGAAGPPRPGENLVVPGGGGDGGVFNAIGGAAAGPLGAALGFAGDVAGALTSPLDFLRSLPDTAARLAVFGVIAAGGVAIVVLGAYRAVAPARQAVTERVEQVAAVAPAL